MVWVADDSEPRTWAPVVEDRETGEREMTVEILDEPCRPLVSAQGAA
jgi:hypothetical protein